MHCNRNSYCSVWFTPFEHFSCQVNKYVVFYLFITYIDSFRFVCLISGLNLLFRSHFSEVDCRRFDFSHFLLLCLMFEFLLASMYNWANVFLVFFFGVIYVISMNYECSLKLVEFLSMSIAVKSPLHTR